MDREEQLELQLALDQIKVHLEAIDRILKDVNGLVAFKTFDEAKVDVAVKEAVGFYEM